MLEKLERDFIANRKFTSFYNIKLLSKLWEKYVLWMKEKSFPALMVDNSDQICKNL